MASEFDHGILNIPLAKRGNIDAQIDRYKAEQAERFTAQVKAARDGERAKHARIAELLAALPDERVLALAKPLNRRNPSTARAALASASRTRPDLWIKALENEVAAALAKAA